MLTTGVVTLSSDTSCSYILSQMLAAKAESMPVPSGPVSMSCVATGRKFISFNYPHFKTFMHIWYSILAIIRVFQKYEGYLKSPCSNIL